MRGGRTVRLVLRVLLLLLILVAFHGLALLSAADWKGLTPLPGDLRIDPADPSLAKKVVLLSGAWQGPVRGC